MKYKCAYCGSDSTSLAKTDSGNGTVTCKNCGQSFAVQIPKTRVSLPSLSDIYNSRAFYYFGFALLMGITILQILPRDNPVRAAIIGFFFDLIVGDGLSAGRVFFGLFFLTMLLAIPSYKFKRKL